MTRFDGKTALVTGAAGGIGSAIVRMLRAEGARVAVADRDVSGVAAEVHLAGDLTDPAYVEGLAQAAHDVDVEVEQEAREAPAGARVYRTSHEWPVKAALRTPQFYVLVAA